VTLDYLVLGIIAGLAAVERKGFLQAMLSRPIALAPAAGLAFGDLQGGILLAAPLELLWLGAVNLGAALPAHEALGVSAIAGAAVLSGRALGTGVTPGVAILAVLICAPLALLGRRADGLVEHANEWLARRAEALLAAGNPRAAVRENLYGLFLPFAISFVLAPLGAAVAVVAIPALLRRFPSGEWLLSGSWVAFGSFACAAGAKALRAERAPAVFFGALAAGLVLALLCARHAP